MFLVCRECTRGSFILSDCQKQIHVERTDRTFDVAMKRMNDQLSTPILASPVKSNQPADTCRINVCAIRKIQQHTHRKRLWLQHLLRALVEEERVANNRPQRLDGQEILLICHDFQSKWLCRTRGVVADRHLRWSLRGTWTSFFGMYLVCLHCNGRLAPHVNKNREITPTIRERQPLEVAARVLATSSPTAYRRRSGTSSTLQHGDLVSTIVESHFIEKRANQ